MEVNTRKGFIRTLEAIVASLLFLGIITTVIPQTVSQPNDQKVVKQAVHSSLEALDKSGELGNPMTVNEVESDLKPYVPLPYNYSVQIRYVTNRSKKAVPGDSFHFNSSGYTEIQFWIEDSGITADYRGKNLLTDAEEGYYMKTVEPEGWLNFSGSGRARFDFDSYKIDGKGVTKENLATVNYILGEKEKEIQVKLWK